MGWDKAPKSMLIHVWRLSTTVWRKSRHYHGGRPHPHLTSHCHQNTAERRRVWCDVLKVTMGQSVLIDISTWQQHDMSDVNSKTLSYYTRANWMHHHWLKA